MSAGSCYWSRGKDCCMFGIYITRNVSFMTHWHLWLPWTQTLLQKMQVSLNPDLFYDLGFIIYNNHLRALVLSIWVLEFFFNFLTTVPSNWMTLCVFSFIHSLQHNQSYIHKAIKIRFSSGCSGHSPCLPLWYESRVLAKGCRWLLPCFKLCELLEFKLSCECHYLISLYFHFYFFSLVVTSNCF